uniref:Uncharacterized protein n=1 Tax=Panagrolaimus davidi TaxID=227884 RepID=A0A914PIW7_9BILA
MVEEYRNEIERISKFKIPVSEFWIDTILYEFDFGTNETAMKVLKWVLSILNYQNSVDIENSSLEKYFEIIKNADPKIEKNVVKNVEPLNPISCYFPKHEIQSLKKTQNFSVPRTMIFYMTQNVKINHRILQKLFNCCKYFFAIQPTPICYRLVLGIKEPSKYRRHSLFLNEKDLNFQGLENLYITDIFDIISETPNVYSNVYKRLYKCDAKLGHFRNQILTIPELKFIPDWRKIISRDNYP